MVAGYIVLFESIYEVFWVIIKFLPLIGLLLFMFIKSTSCGFWSELALGISSL